MTTMPRRDNLTELLDQSSPQTTRVTTDVADEITRLQATTRASVQAAPHERRWLRPVVAGVASVLLLGGASAAAAATGLWTVPWADEAVASFTFTLPSGAECEQRIGNVTGLAPNEIAAVENFYRTTDFEALLTDDVIAETIVQRRTGDAIYQNADGSTEPGGFGTEHYNADKEYSTAVWDVVVTALDTELALDGIDGIETDLTFQGQLSCPGADW